MLQILSQLPIKTWSWAALFGSAALLLLSALYFQYSMDLAPCIMCIYQRTAVLGILLSALLVLVKNHVATRALAFVGWGVSALWGLMIAIEHVDIQTASNPFFVTCEIVPNFPVPLHEWLPGFFGATGDCGDIDWQFVGMSMPQWMIVIFAVYSALFALTLITHLLGRLIAR